MVDTTLRPRPTFSTFLQSDNSTNDGLSYYDYQRLVRSKKVALLQEKKQRSYEPGYKKPTSSGPFSRKIFTALKRPESDGEIKVKTAETDTKSDVNTQTIKDASTSKTDGLSLGKLSLESKDGKAVTMSDRLPRIKQRVRMVKSATARDYRSSSPHLRADRQERPKTVSGVKDFSRHSQSQSAIGTGITIKKCYIYACMHIHTDTYIYM